MYETLATSAIERYEEREETIGTETMRAVERQIMLRLIDQRWRDHLYAMDYLREGIHLRAMGQRDPATEWQREGFDMFGQMVDAIDSEFVRYIMHVEIKESEPEEAPKEATGGAVVDTNEVKPAAGSATGTKPKASGAKKAAAKGPATPQKKADVPSGEVVEADSSEAAAPSTAHTKVNNEFENVGRNERCPCGSGSKFKHCHGA